MYNQIADLLQRRADRQLKVMPVEYPPPPLNALFADVLAKVQIAIIILLFANDRVLPSFFRENKMLSFFGIFFVGNMVAATLTKTSAFEIYAGRKLVFSALRNSRMPNMQDLVKGFGNAGITLNVGN
mmetsp:Transcript_3554/g.5729  ORF Transcript_3554/g.5729 Transcript_3554/m.5729 type:complete len:127 (+) Transcript_3554:429-809(+)